MSSKQNSKDDSREAPSGLAEAPEADVNARSPAETPRDASRVVNATSAFPVESPAAAVENHQDAELTRLDHYRLLGLIGRGGMGDVYRAHDESCNRTVAVKVLPPDLASDPTFVQRFEREAKAVAALSHPNIVPVYSIGEDQGHRYFSMAYIEGESLEDLLRRKRKLPLRETLHIVTQCLAALEAAHNKGLIHRDIKPGNVLLQRHTGRAYLVDFGLVRQISETTRVTATGLVMGTVDYMAPEQARGMKDIDQRADLYAVGALLYHVLSGRLPFESTTLEGMMYGHAYEEPHPLDQAAPDLPRELVELVHRLLAKDRDARPAACHEVLEALAPLQELDFQVRHLSGQLRSVASANESVAAAAGGDIPKSYRQLGRMRDRVTTIFRRPSPELLAALESADKELQPAIADCEQRRQRLVALRDEGRSLLEELQEQIQANLQAASEAMQQVEAPESDDARETALAKKKACDEHVAVLQAQSHELGERLDELDLELAKADAELATLRSQQGAVQGRMAIVKQPTKRISPAVMAVVVVLLAGLVTTPFLWNYFYSSSREVPPLAVAPFDAEQTRRHQENWAEYLGEPVEKEIDLGGVQKLTMVLIPPGEFRMGSTQAEQIRFLEDANADQYSINRIPSEGPEHRVRITKPFWVSRYEVTRGQFGQFVQQTGYKTDAERNGKGGSHVVDERWVHDPRFIWSFDLGVAQSEDHPVVNISWNDAIAFCRWLSNKKSGHIFLLPTEAQWEYVCRAGTTTCWHCGDNEDDLLQYGWSRANSDGSTHPVGQLKPNAFGLYDLHGNVWEWCADWRGREYYATSPTSDPTGKPSDSFRVHRGGNWVATADKSRSAFRGDNAPERSGSHLGFRPILALEVTERGAVEVRADEAIADQIEVVFRKRGQTVEVLKQGRFTAQLQEGVYDVELKSPQASAPLKHDRIAVRTDQVTLIEITLQKGLGPIERTGQPLLATLKGHAAGITHVDYAPNRKLLASSSSDGIIKLWDVETGDLVDTLFGSQGSVRNIDFSPDETILASAGQDGTILFWDVAGEDALQGAVPCQALPDGRILLWDVVRNSARVFKEGIRSWTKLCFSPDGQTIATTGTNYKSVDIWNTETGELGLTLACGDRFLEQFAFSPDGKSLAALIESRTGDGKPSGGYIILWDLDTGKESWSVFADTRRVLSIGFSPDGETLVTGNANHRACLRSVESGRQVGDLGSHATWVYSTSYSASGDLIASASIDAIVWDVATRHRVGMLKGNPRILMVTFLGSRTLASWGAAPRKNDIKLWDVQAVIAASGGLTDHRRSIAELSEMIAAQRGSPSDRAELYEQRAFAYAHLEDWKSAAADFREAAQLVSEKKGYWALQWMRAGVMLLMARDDSSYPEHVQRMIERFRQTENHSFAERTAKLCVLPRQPVGDRELVERLAEFAVRTSTESLWGMLCPTTQALVRYRYGDYDSALEAITESRRRSSVPGHSDPEIAEMLNQIVEALCYAQKGETKRATESLNKARATLQPFFANPHTLYDRTLPDWLIAKLLFEEAQALLRSKPSDNPTSSTD